MNDTATITATLIGSVDSYLWIASLTAICYVLFQVLPTLHDILCADTETIQKQYTQAHESLKSVTAQEAQISAEILVASYAVSAAHHATMEHIRRSTEILTSQPPRPAYAPPDAALIKLSIFQHVQAACNSPRPTTLPEVQAALSLLDYNNQSTSNLIK